jgi:hypothetical protein
LTNNLDKWLIKDLPEISVSPPAIVKEAPIVLKDKLENRPVSHTPSKSPPSDTAQYRITKSQESYEGKLLKSFTFNGRTEQVRYWDKMLTMLCDYFAVSHKKDFEKVLWISGENKTYFSRYQDQLKIPEKVKKTDIYVETKLNPDEIIKTAKALLAEFGYSPDNLKVTTQ